MSQLAGKRIIVTGAASGIGRATSLLAASQGASLVVVDYADAIDETAAEIAANGGTAKSIQADISDETAVAAFVAACISEYDGLDAIYANAGVVGAYKPFLEMTADDWQQAVSINLVGTFLCIKHAAAHFVKQRSGSIVCTASVAGMRANAGPVDYSASKAGVISMVQTIAYELYGTDVRINAVCPGLIETGMTKPVFDGARAKGLESRIGQINPSGRYGNPDEIAAMACFLMSDGASYVNGQAIPVDGGLSASHPWVYPQARQN